MQQTSKYQFNLVEGGDDFSPTPLNQNMEKVEQELSGLASSVMANLGTIGHNLRVETGSYTGTGTYGQNHPNRLTFSLYPLVVMIVCASRNYAMPPCTMMRPAPCSVFVAGSTGALVMPLTWQEHGVSWYASASATDQGNEEGATYHWIALGY